MGYIYMCSCAVHVTIFSTGRKFQRVSNFMELHALSQTTGSYAVLMLVHYSFAEEGGVLTFQMDDS